VTAPSDAGPFGAGGTIPRPGPPPAAPAGDRPDDRMAEAAEVVARLDTLDELPVAEHVAVFEVVHRTLQDTLAAVDGS
jgi:hypothetical protein